MPYGWMQGLAPNLPPNYLPALMDLLIRMLPLIAIGAFMVTLWHAVALLVFGSVGYRGRWETLAADIVLFGVPAAVVISLIVGYVFPVAAY